MWSDRAPPQRLRGMADALHTALPAPRPGALSAERSLRGSASPEQAAELLHADPGFAWMQGNRLLREPLAVLSYADGCAEVSAPGGRVRLAGRGFEILEA